MVVKAICPEWIDDFNVLKNVSPSVPWEHLFLDILVYLCSTEAVRQRRDMEAA